MARFVHIADARRIAKIRRDGLRAGRIEGVFCVPMTADPSHAFQWACELRRRDYRHSIAVVFVVPDGEPVIAGHYGAEGERMTAAQAVALFRNSPSPLGMDIRIPRCIARSELTAIRAVPKAVGWRFFPTAKGRQPLWPSPGERNAARLRRSINARADREYQEFVDAEHSLSLP